MFKIVLAVGNEEIGSMISEIPNFEVVENTEDLDILMDIMEFIEADYIVLNTLLNQEKSKRIAAAARQQEIKIIAIVENFSDKEFIAAMVGASVRAFVTFDDLDKLPEVAEHYPKQFDFIALEASQKAVEERPPKAILPTPTKKVKEKHLIGAVTIGVFSVSRGAGATRTAVKIAERLASCMQTACIEFDGRQDMESMYDLNTRAFYAAPEGDIEARDTIGLLYGSGEYKAVVVDFGTVYEVTNKGVLCMESLNEMRSSELMRCKYKVGVGFAEEWHSGKLKGFEQEYFNPFTQNGSLFFLLAGDPSQVKCARKNYDLKIFNRDGDEYLDHLLLQLGMPVSNKRNFSLIRKEKRH